jgi:hypothetical protein
VLPGYLSDWQDDKLKLIGHFVHCGKAWNCEWLGQKAAKKQVAEK